MEEDGETINKARDIFLCQWRTEFHGFRRDRLSRTHQLCAVKFGLARKRWVGFGVIADNLITIGAKLAAA
jgi:hypothetical protein